MKPEGLNIVRIDYNNAETPESVKETHPILYIDGDAYCCVLGPDPQAGIFGQGRTAKEAMQDFDKHFRELLANPVAGDPVSDFIQHRRI